MVSVGSRMISTDIYPGSLEEPPEAARFTQHFRRVPTNPTVVSRVISADSSPVLVEVLPRTSGQSPNISLVDPTPLDEEKLTIQGRLALAVLRRENAKVNSLLRDGADVNARPLFNLLVFNNQRARVVEYRRGTLEVHGPVRVHFRADRTKFSRTILQEAVDISNEEIVALLIREGADVNAQPAEYFGRTALQAAAERGNRMLGSLLIGAGANVNALPAAYYGRTALQAAAEYGHEDLVALLMSAGANVNGPPAKNLGMTALQAAAGGGYEKLVKLLMDAGADVNDLPAGYYGRTALQIAAEYGHKNLVTLLISAGANLNAPPSEHGGRTALQAAAQGGHEELITLLITRGANINAPPAKYHGRTALQAAAEDGYENIVEILIQLGADVNAPPAEHYGATALQIAAEGGYKKLVKLLIGAGADINTPPTMNFGKTALQAAAGCGYGEIVKLLVDAGAKINGVYAEHDGRAALQAAAEAGYDGVVISLIDAGADVNAPPARYFGRTALQAASEYGHESVVVSLLDSGAHVNASPAEYFGRTALQAAAQGGHEKLIKLLIDSGADINALPSVNVGRTALQAAAEGGHEESVTQLIRCGAEINAQPAEYFGRTALQAAAEYGHETLVQSLILAGAIIDAPPAQHAGTTALSAAVEGGYGKVVIMLLNPKPDVDSPKLDILGQTPLQALLGHASEETLSLVIKAGFNADERDLRGQTILHQVVGDAERLSLLLKLGIFDVNAQDHSGSTPLLTAVRKQSTAAVVLLIKEGAGVNTEDYSGRAPLGAALEQASEELLHLLLQNGAQTNHLTVERLASLLKAGSDPKDHTALVLRESQNRFTTVEATSLSATCIDDLHCENWTSRSIYLLCTPRPDKTVSFSNPLHYLMNVTTHADISETTIQWSWFTLERRSRYNLTLRNGIPNGQTILSCKPAKLMLVGYVYFVGVVEDVGIGATKHNPESTAVGPFKVKAQDIEISWMMRESSRGTHSRPYMRTFHYRGTLRLERLSIPRHAVRFFISFLDDVQDKWLELIEKARLHLGRIRDAQLVTAGKDPHVIDWLLNDSQQWIKLRNILAGQVSKSKELLNDFRSHDVLSRELVHYSRESSGYRERSGYREPKAITDLSQKIRFFERDCSDEISDLIKQTGEMIGLEFNLVSIFEARRSIEMAVVSNSMSVSMKRLSWITFIFLPLSFVSALFGMNVSILKSYPSWLWYLAFAIPLLGSILVVWLLFKYLDITNWIERNIGLYLESLRTGKAEVRPPPSGSTVRPEPEKIKKSVTFESEVPQGTTSKKAAWGVNFTLLLRRKQRDHDEEKNTTPAPVEI